MVVNFLVFFFFKQKTAYEMRISDWSSDVCSSDLLFENRQHRLARDRGPAAKHHRNLVLGDQFARLFGEQRPVGGRIDHDGFDLLAEQAALLVEIVDHHQDGVLQCGLRDCHGARQRMQHAHLTRSEEHTYELQALMRITYAYFYLK